MWGHTTLGSTTVMTCLFGWHNCRGAICLKIILLKCKKHFGRYTMHKPTNLLVNCLNQKTNARAANFREQRGYSPSLSRCTVPSCCFWIGTHSGRPCSCFTGLLWPIGRTDIVEHHTILCSVIYFLCCHLQPSFLAGSKCALTTSQVVGYLESICRFPLCL